MKGRLLSNPCSKISRAYLPSLRDVAASISQSGRKSLQQKNSTTHTRTIRLTCRTPVSRKTLAQNICNFTTTKRILWQKFHEKIMKFRVPKGSKKSSKLTLFGTHPQNSHFGLLPKNIQKGQKSRFFIKKWPKKALFGHFREKSPKFGLPFFEILGFLGRGQLISPAD